jgi:hypothetical protein
MPILEANALRIDPPRIRRQLRRQMRCASTRPASGASFAGSVILVVEMLSSAVGSPGAFALR